MRKVSSFLFLFYSMDMEIKICLSRLPEIIEQEESRSRRRYNVMCSMRVMTELVSAAAREDGVALERITTVESPAE